jgi:hypothetical protein
MNWEDKPVPDIDVDHTTPFGSYVLHLARHSVDRGASQIGGLYYVS